MTAADLAVGAMVALATGFLGWASVRSDWPVAASLLLVLAGGSLLTIQVRSWLRSLRQPARRLVPCRDGSLWLHEAGQAPCRATLRLGTRLIGPSVFLDLIAESNPAGERLRTWLTPFDVPQPALRRWSVVLTRSGQLVGS